MPEKPEAVDGLLEDPEFTAAEEPQADLTPQTVADLAAVDRAVRTYRRKLAGLVPWSTFEAPPSVREAA